MPSTCAAGQVVCVCVCVCVCVRACIRAGSIWIHIQIHTRTNPLTHALDLRFGAGGGVSMVPGLEAEPLGSPLNRRRAVPAAYRPRDLAAALDADLTLRENKKKRSSEDDDV